MQQTSVGGNERESKGATREFGSTVRVLVPASRRRRRCGEHSGPAGCPTAQQHDASTAVFPGVARDEGGLYLLCGAAKG